MQKIQPSISGQDIICVETAAPATGLVVFGASGDLTHRKLLVSLMEISRQGLLCEQFYLLGCGRKDFSDEQFRQNSKEAIQEKCKGTTDTELKAFINKLYYISGDYSDSSFYDKLTKRLAELDEQHEVGGNLLF